MLLRASVFAVMGTFFLEFELQIYASLPYRVGFILLSPSIKEISLVLFTVPHYSTSKDSQEKTWRKGYLLKEVVYSQHLSEQEF